MKEWMFGIAEFIFWTFIAFILIASLCSFVLVGVAMWLCSHPPMGMIYR